MRGWRPALRIARRGVRRNLVRSLLIAGLVAVPVAGATLSDVLARTLSAPEREAQRAMGSADAMVRVTPWSRLEVASRAPGDFRPPGEGKPDRDASRVDLAALLPPGSRIARGAAGRELRLARGERVVRTMLELADASEPLHGHRVRLVAGRAAGAPGEVLVTRNLAQRLDLLDGDGSLREQAAVALEDGTAAKVTGLGLAPFCLDCEQVFAAAGSDLDRATAPLPDRTNEVEYLVGLPPGSSAVALARTLAAEGVAVVPRDFFLHPERYDELGTGPVTEDSLRAVALVAVIGGFGLLEVVLLAGTAFAVGARRQTRELGLVAATGGTARDVRRIVLAQGLVLGALGAALGVAAGFAAALAGRPLWQNLDDAEITAWAFGPLEIAAAGLVGILSGLAAAVIPAVGAARMRPVDALAGRFRQGRAASRRGPLAGAGLVAAGAVCGLAGDRLLADDFAAYTRVLADVERTGAYVTTPSPLGPLALILGGATLAVAGLVLLAPALIGWLSRAGARLPVASRLAVRDAARHRHRTGPATSAISVAVAGSVVLALVMAGSFRRDELRYVKALPPEVLAVEPAASDPDAAARGAEQAAALLPGARVHELQMPLRPLYADETLPPDIHVTEARGVWVQQRGAGCVEHGDMGLHSASPAECQMVSAGAGPLALAGDPALDDLAAGGDLDREARAALAAGRTIVFHEQLLHEDGSVVVDSGWNDALDRPNQVRLPGHLAERAIAYSYLPSGIVPRAVAREQGWDLAAGRVFVAYDKGATADEVDAALDAAEGAGVSAYVERGAATPSNAILLIVAAAAGFVTLVGVAISVALSAAEGRADLATLAAVGAAPRRRRALAGSQALLISGVGCALGVALGTFVGFTARATTGSPEFIVPWANLAVTGLAVPLLAVLVATLCTPSRLPMVRRAE